MRWVLPLAVFFPVVRLWGADLVDVSTMARPPLAEIRYATTYNFTGEKLYDSPSAFVHADLVAALEAIQAELAGLGLGLKIYDGYRPLSVQQKMWDLIRDERYVSNPAKNKGRHTRGTAVDVTLVDKSGRELPMPSDFDDFTEKAGVDYAGGTPEERRNRDLLQRVMTAHGFESYPHEWWHFDFRRWMDFEPLDVGFDEVGTNGGRDAE
jgi:zinc D-Ala-D-Ala dipeptidase